MIRFIIIFLIVLTNVTFAEIKKVNIVGNARVSSTTIELLIDKKISNIDSIYINNLKENVNYSIYDMTGKAKKEGLMKKTENTIDLKYTGLTSGTYFILIQGEKTSQSLKFILD